MRSVLASRNAERHLFQAARACRNSVGRPIAASSALPIPLRRRQLYATSSDAVSVQHVGSLPPAGPVHQDDRPIPTLPFLPQGEQERNSAAWVEALDRVLPPSLRRPGSSKALSYLDERQALSQIVLLARSRGDVDVLAELGLTGGRWDALLWAANCLLETPRPSTFFRDHTIPTSARWPSDQSLEEVTNSSKAPASLFAEYPVEATAIADPSLSLDDLTSASHSALQTRSHQQSRDVLGEIWRTLGRLTLSVASNKESEKAIMPNVLRVIAMLHRQEYIPNKVFSETTSNDRLALRQPPFLHSLSSEILMALIDTSIVVEMAYGADPSTRPAFKPELWFEFILWCCVHGGWLEEAAKLVRTKKKWNLISWYTGPEPLARDWTYEKAEELYLQPENADDQSKTSRRVNGAISSEVVSALIDGLVTTATSSTTQHEVDNVFETVRALKGVLGASAMNLGTSTWDEVVARFTELRDLSADSRTKTLEFILELSETFGREMNAANAVDKPKKPHSPSPAYIFDGSAAIIGLYHRLLAAYVKDHDTDSALRVLARLQYRVDENKSKALQSFLTKLTRLPQRPKNSNDLRTANRSDGFEKLDYPAFFPNLPTPILASLLDLMTESQAFDVGRWMIHSEDVDGPLIPKTLFADQAIAPALIRYAAEARDDELLKQLKSSQSVQIRGPTLVALAESHLLDAEWQNAAKVLSTMREYEMHKWIDHDFARIIGALLTHLGAGRPREQSDQGTLMLQGIFQGRFGALWQGRSQRDSMIAILSTMQNSLALMLKPFLSLGHQSHLDMSREAFDLLLSRASQTFGSTTGQRLFELWCRKYLSNRSVREPDRSDVLHIPISQRAESFSAGQNQPGPQRSPPLAPTLTGYIEPDISTLRIVAQQALSEYGMSAQNDEETSSQVQPTEDGQPQRSAMKAAAEEVLAWAQSTFQRQFNLRPVDIEHELEGFVTKTDTVTSPRLLYSKSTMRIWQAVHHSSPGWAMASESKMRDFAIDPSMEQVVFDATDSSGRRFLHCLAADFGLISESFGDEDERQVSVFKTPKKPEVPSMTVGEAVRRVKKHSLSEAV